MRSDLEHLEINLLVLLAVAAAVARISHRVRMPYAIGLVLAGLVLGNVTAFSGPQLTKDLLFLVVLPGLLFEGAFGLDFAEFWMARYSVLTLAVPGLVASTLLTATALWIGVNQLQPGGVTFIESMAFGALISATDPISVLSLFRSLGVDSRLCALVEGEALFNDGTAVVIFTIVLGLAGGGDIAWTGVATEFARIAGLAVLVGAAVGCGASVLTRAIDDTMVEITMTLLCAYGAFIAAELLGLSGVIACVVAGLIAGTWGAGGMQPATRRAVDSFWSYAAFLLNSFIFLLIGTENHLVTLARYWPEILIGWLAINAARAVVVYLTYIAMRVAGFGGLSLPGATVLTWGGLRGGLSMVLALALPQMFPHREMLVNTTYGVVLLSLVVQGLTMKPLLRAVGLVKLERSPQAPSG